MKSLLTKIETEKEQESKRLAERLKNIDNYETENTGTDCRKKREASINPDRRQSTILARSCIFCKKNKYINRRLESLMLCMEFRAVDSIKKAARAANDFQMLVLALQDLIASEAHYHSSCYKSYTKTKSGKPKSAHKEVEVIAFKEVITICHELLKERKNTLH